MFCMDLIKTAITAQYSINLSVFYNQGLECLLRGTNWVFNSESLVIKVSKYCPVPPLFQHYKKIVSLKRRGICYTAEQIFFVQQCFCTWR